MTPPAFTALDVRALLTIDVAAELRKLTAAQLEGPFQLPAELVRRAIRAGAQRIDVTFVTSGRRIVVDDDGPALSRAALDATAVLLDGRRHNDERHQALITLEAAGELALLALVALPGLRALDIVARAGGQRLRFAGGTPTLDVAAAPGVGNQLTFVAPSIDRGHAARWLAAVARFAPVKVTVDGVAVASGLADALITAPLPPPLVGRVALVAAGDAGHVHVLGHGLVTAHVSLPGAAGCEAALELGGGSGAAGADALSPARLRDAVMPLLPAVTAAALALVPQLAPAIPALSERQRARLARITLQALRRRAAIPALAHVPVLRTVSARGPGFVDVASLQRHARSGDGPATLLALFPDQAPQRHALGDDLVLVADDAERTLIAEVLGVRFVPPPRREAAHSLAAHVRRLAAGVRHHAAATLDRLRHPLRPRPVPDAELSPGEQTFLAALRAYVRTQPTRPSDVVLCAGRGPVRRSRSPQPALLLPRGNPVVRAAMRAFAADARWLHIIDLALADAA